MPIPVSQLETWSLRTTASASARYERLREVLQNDAALRDLTGREREPRGEITLCRVIRDGLGFDAALNKERE